MSVRTPEAHIEECDTYLGERTGCYEWRCHRYDASWRFMATSRGLVDTDTVVDVGAGWTELGARLREKGWRGRYWPVDGAFDGTDLESWVPPRRAEWFVALELVEHLYAWPGLVRAMQRKADKGVILSTPNPRTTDVLGMDRTHVCEVWQHDLERLGFTVTERSFYGQPEDSLLATWITKEATA